MDQGIINFIVDEEESQLLATKRKAFEDVTKKKKFQPGAHDYLANRVSFRYTDADIFGVPKDDTKIDEVKVMHQLHNIEALETSFKETIDEKLNDFNDLRQLLINTRLISEPIVEEAREFNPTKNQFFVPAENIDFATIEWDQIQHTSLGRRLQAYFDQLKADRRMMA